MLRIVAKRRVREGAAEAYEALAKELTAASRAEAGNLAYTFARSADDARLYAILETWESEAALAAHRETEHYQRLIPQLAALTETPFPIEIYHELM